MPANRQITASKMLTIANNHKTKELSMRALFIISSIAIVIIAIVRYTQRNKTNGEQELETLTRLQLPELTWQSQQDYTCNNVALWISISERFLFCGALNQSEAHEKKNNSRNCFTLARLAGLYAIGTELTHLASNKASNSISSSGSINH